MEASKRQGPTTAEFRRNLRATERLGEALDALIMARASTDFQDVMALNNAENIIHDLRNKYLGRLHDAV